MADVFPGRRFSPSYIVLETDLFCERQKQIDI